MLQARIFMIASIIGYLLFYVLTHPKSSIHRRLPKLKIKWLQLFPSVTVTISGKIIHIHHWLGFSIILVVSIFIDSGILSYLFTKGILSGGIIQGLFTPKSFKLIYEAPISLGSGNTLGLSSGRRLLRAFSRERNPAEAPLSGAKEDKKE